MKIKICRAVLIILFSICSLTPLFGQTKKVDEGWYPDINQPIGQLEEILETLTQQQPKNYTIANIYFLYDAKLFIVFQKYIHSLPRTTQLQAKKEQLNWLRKREKISNSAYAEYEGGTLASYNSGQASIAFTKERIKQIELKLKP
jgi:uncharacterized protein YecT (DUF1311 family)